MTTQSSSVEAQAELPLKLAGHNLMKGLLLGLIFFLIVGFGTLVAMFIHHHVLLLAVSALCFLWSIVIAAMCFSMLAGLEGKSQTKIHWAIFLVLFVIVFLLPPMEWNAKTALLTALFMAQLLNGLAILLVHDTRKKVEKTENEPKSA